MSDKLTYEFLCSYVDQIGLINIKNYIPRKRIEQLKL